MSEQKHFYGGETGCHCTILQYILTASFLVDATENL
jgi:hypothetical protein